MHSARPSASSHSLAKTKGQSALPPRPRDAGQSLPDSARQLAERALGHQFGSVRIHPDDPLPGTIGAVAFARGEHLHFRPGAFAPQTPQGQQLLHHELAHVVQYRSGLVDAALSPGEVRLDPHLEASASRSATLLAGPSALASHCPASEGAPALPVLDVEGSKRYRKKVRRQLQAMMPPGAFVRTDANGRVQVHHQPAFAPGPADYGHQLVSRMVANPHRVAVSSVKSDQGGVVRGVPENPQAPNLRQNPTGWLRHYAYGALGLFSDEYRMRQAMAAAADPQRGTDHRIHYDANAAPDSRRIIVDNPVGGTMAHTAPQERVLAHELIHADRNQRGRLAADATGTALVGSHNYPRRHHNGVPAPWFPLGPNEEDQAFAELEEMETVGLPSAPVVHPNFAAVAARPNWTDTNSRLDPADITENMMFPAPRRAKYNPNA